MQLYLSQTSPFARKVRVALIEKELGAAVEEIVIDPWNESSVLGKVNPLMQVPVLITDSGLAMPNSDSILHWLERRHPQPPLWPQNDDVRSSAEGNAALAHGVIECAVYIVLERRKPEGQQGSAMITRREQAIRQVVAKLEQSFTNNGEHFQLDGIGIAVALAYLDFRLPKIDWRASAPRLADFLAWAAQRPSMQATIPQVT